MLPIQAKPNFDVSYKSTVIDIPNALTKEDAAVLIEFATSSNSGLHRRGSKTYGVDAEFSTCLIPSDYQIYKILDPIWEQYTKILHVPHSFIEQYELKMYSVGDSFGFHQDNRGSIKHNIMRKSNLIVQLTDDSDYDGGDLIVGNYTCPRQFGTAIGFPSYLLHCVTPITKGTRISLIGHAWGPLY
jgi:predicted 2-oxoglutarate/Fe(II)-dependent dioxygenase YbiX